MSNVIQFYDIPGNATPDKAWSPNTWKTRYTLNFKGIPYKTIWVEYPDIASVCKEIGAEPTSIRPDGPYYTLPVIHDPSTGKTISDSAAIARYLDKTYPDTPVVIPPETDALHAAFNFAFSEAIVRALAPIMLPATNAQLNPRSEEFFRRTREESAGGVKLEDWAPPGSEKRAKAWEKIRAGFGQIAKWLSADGNDKLLFLGDKVSYADITIVGWVIWVKRVLGPDSAEWKDFETWDDGKWAKQLALFEKYEVVPDA
ncbi:CsMn06 [Gelatoporia subvermispora B]|uniref:CsMn06 n=1 Tax=Ceriporiopsis subvermispora (strain B) TaxID=914234 RepID=M2R618_CERS8|nr:CsMn06 [Gelatoporia subvermispora B]6J3E_A Chain A, glutathione S-transferase [Gelatoporia subvermispora B]6J3E_B Chain B, glutathione S-transferase [Gelatoporia subvermispora B]6J3F_A Chain A, glutathione S-transferase [Gelatoporia subvermispora B]6J3F_B Chain B, glutathione S-transferase [Gelatoporia subvermispora B]